MKKMLSNSLLLIIFFIITTIFGWISSKFTENILNKLSIINVILIDSIIGFIILVLLMAMSNHSFYQIKNEFTSLSKKEILYFILLGILGTIFGLGSNIMIKHNKVGKIEIIRLIISLLVGAIALHVTQEKKMTISRILGIVIMLFGGYLLMRE